MKLDRICNGKERLSLTTMEKNVDNKRSNEILENCVYCIIAYIFEHLTTKSHKTQSFTSNSANVIIRAKEKY